MVILSVISAMTATPGVSMQTPQFEKQALEYWNNFISSLVSYLVDTGQSYNTLEVRVYKSQTGKHFAFVGGITKRDEGCGDMFRLRNDGSFEKKLPKDACKAGKSMEEMLIDGEAVSMISRMMGLPPLN